MVLKKMYVIGEPIGSRRQHKKNASSLVPHFTLLVINSYFNGLAERVSGEQHNQRFLYTLLLIIGVTGLSNGELEIFLIFF